MKIDNLENKKLSDSEIEISGELAVSDFDAFVKKSIEHFSQNMEVPGFRKGHVPEKQVLKKAGEEAILHKASEFALQKAYPQVISEQNIEPIARPEITITKIARGNALGFKIKVAVMPELELPDYKSISQKITDKKEEIKVEEKEVDESLEYLRKSRLSSESSAKEGASKDKPEELPELNDEFAKSVGKFETLDALKDTIRQNIKFEKEMKAREKKRAEILEAVANAVKIDMPQALIDAEKEKMLEEFSANVSQTGLKWEDYLKNIKKTEEELKRDWTDDAKKRVKFGLILREIGEKEKIEVPAGEIDGYIKQVLARYPEETRRQIDENHLRHYAEGVLKNEKIWQILEAPVSTSDVDSVDRDK